MPSSPVLPAVSPEGGTFIGGDYFCPLVKTTSAPLPPIADPNLELYRDDLNSGPSTSLTSISSSAPFADSSASISHTSLTSISPQLSLAHRTTSRSSQDDYHGHSSSQLQNTVSYQTAEQRAPLRLADERLTEHRSTSSSPSTPFSPGPAAHQGTPQYSGSHFYGSQVPSQSSPSLLQRTELLSKPHFDPFSRVRIHPRAGAGQSAPSHSQQKHRHRHQQSSPSGIVPSASSRHSAGQPSTKPQRSGIPNAFGSSFNSSCLLPSNPSGAPTGPQCGLQGAFLGTSIARDALLAYAHRLYNNATNVTSFELTTILQQSDPNEGAPPQLYYRQLFPLLESIRSQHPQHLPTLLLSSCVYFSAGDYDACLRVCLEILDIDPNYVRLFFFVITQLITGLQVEAMSNIGMVFKARGALRDAENMWLKAIRLRPTYWDAIVRIFRLPSLYSISILNVLTTHSLIGQPFTRPL
jgi:hypothetical protein